MNRSPLLIRIALHYHYSPYDWWMVHTDSPASREIIATLLREGILRTTSSEHDRVYKLTNRGQKYVELLMEVRFPVKATAWVDAANARKK